MNILNLPRSEEAAILFLQSKKMLPTSKICVNGHDIS